MIRFALAGAAGRMGCCVIRLAAEEADLDLVAALEGTHSEAIAKDSGENAGLPRNQLPVQDHTETDFDVLLDFSTPEGTMHWLDFCLTKQRPIVVCTTGHDDAQVKAISAAGDSIAVLKAANTSLGVNAMLRLVADATRMLGDDADIEIVEAHHRFKKDAPSGTANALLRAVQDARGEQNAGRVVHGRSGLSEPRSAHEIGMHALRIGDATGEHEVHFGPLGETLTIRHRAHSRDTFARGALTAVRWMAGRSPGRYTMQDVLFA